MTRSLATILAVILVGMAALSGYQHSAARQDDGRRFPAAAVIRGENIRLRLDPAEASEDVLILQRGEEVTITSEPVAADGLEFYPVEVLATGDAGWVRTLFIDPNSIAPLVVTEIEPLPEPEPAQEVVPVPVEEESERPRRDRNNRQNQNRNQNQEDEPAVEELPAEEPVAEEPPAEEVPAEEPPAEEPAAEEPADDAGRRKEGVGGRHHLIASADVERHQRDQQGVRAGRDTDRVGGTAERGDLLLQRADFRAEDEVLRFDHAVHGGAHFIANGYVLRLEIE